MFDQIKLEIGAVIGIIILCVAGYFIWKYNHAINEAATEKTANAQLVKSNAIDDKVIATQKKSDAITDATSVAVTEGTIKTQNNTAAITADVNAKLAAIKQKYNDQVKTQVKKPSSSTNTIPTIVQDPAIAEDKAIAQTLINGLWKMYCSGVPDASTCAPPVPTH